MAFLLTNWKPLALLALILGIGGYIQVLKYKVDARDKEIVALRTDVKTLKDDLNIAKAGIGNMDKALAVYGGLVKQSLESLEAVQARIATQNVIFQRELDNVAALAGKAKRIQDAPIVPFFQMDNSLVNVYGASLLQEGPR